MTGEKQTSFQYELQQLINRHSKENDSNTPAFILAQYMDACLAAFSLATKQRDNWYEVRQQTPQSIRVHHKCGIVGCFNCDPPDGA